MWPWRDGEPGWGYWTVCHIPLLCGAERTCIVQQARGKKISSGPPVVFMRGISAALGVQGGAGCAFQRRLVLDELYAGRGKVNCKPAASKALPGPGTAALARSAPANGAPTRSMPVFASMRVPAQGGEGRKLHSEYSATKAYTWSCTRV